VISTTGGEITAVARPWFVLVTTDSPARMGTVPAAGFVGMALPGIPSGRVATSLGPRKTMLVADLACAPAIAAVPVLHWAGVLSRRQALSASSARVCCCNTRRCGRPTGLLPARPRSVPRSCSQQ
jgi:MFS family permease